MIIDYIDIIEVKRKITPDQRAKIGESIKKLSKLAKEAGIKIKTARSPYDNEMFIRPRWSSCRF